MRTVLIFAHECAPYHSPASTIGAQRVAQFAKHLPSFGWRAIVICCDARERGAGFGDETARRIERLIREANPSKSLIIPIPSLPWDGLLDRWWRASVRGSPRAAQRLLWRKPLTALKQLTYGDYSSAWQPCARRAADIARQHVRIDACIGEHSPDAGILLARWFARLTGVPWVADFRDPVLSPFPPTLRVLYLPRVRSVLSSAAHIVNVNEYWAELDRETLRCPTTSIPNGFDPDEFVTGAVPVPGATFTIVYCGSVKPGIQAIGPFFDALRIVAAKVPAGETDWVRFVYRGNSAAYVRDLARKAGVGAMVDANDQIPREESLRLLQTADALLLLSTSERVKADKYFMRGFYPAKTFEYFGARRPILCIPGDGGMLDELIRDTRTGVVLADPIAIAGYLRAAHRQWQNRESPAYAPNANLVEKFTRYRLTGTLAALLDSVLSGQPVGLSQAS